MDIDEEVASKLRAHINSKWQSGCPMCGTKTWDLAGFTTISVVGKLEPRRVSIGGPGLPSAALVCSNCGNTVLINLIVAGAVSKDG